MRGVGRRWIGDRRIESLQALGTVFTLGVLCAAGALWIAPEEAGDTGHPMPAPVAPGPESLLPTQPDMASSSAEAPHSAETLSAIARRLPTPHGMEIARRLCADEFAGRKAGTPGAERAAAWLTTQFRKIGLEPAPGALDFRQPFTIPVSLIASRWDRKAKLSGNVSAGLRRGLGPSLPPTGSRTLWIEYPCYYGDGFSAEAETVFAGWGVSRRDQGWDDYQGPDVRGKFVLYWEGAPGPGLEREEHARWRDAKGRGARGCLVLSRRTDLGPAGLECPIRDFPVLRLDPGTARRVLDVEPPPPGSPSGQPLPPLRIEVPRTEDPARPVANVIGMIPGADPTVADEVVILSAHYDHLGEEKPVGSGQQTAGSGRPNIGDPGRARTGRRSMQRARAFAPAGNPLSRTGCRPPSTVFPGADDDASGVAVVLGAARALRAAGARPRRTLLFCLWTAEEEGLLGSRAYVEHPLVPLEKTRFALQVEMVGAGRTDSFTTSSARPAGDGYDALQEAAAHLGLSLDADTCRGTSDHLPFLRRGVPALVITASGEHPDYHTPRDTPDRLHPAGIDNATRLCALTVWREADR
jgi:aminopeptidase YwaD